MNAKDTLLWKNRFWYSSCFTDIKVNDVIQNLKEKNFSEVRKWVNDNLDNDSTVLLRHVYDAISETLDGPSIAAAVLIIAKYDYQICLRSRSGN